MASRHIRTPAACMCGSKTVIFVGCVQRRERFDLLVGLASPRMSMSPVPIGMMRSFDLRLVALRMELEGDLEMAGRVLAVRVHVDVGKADARAGAQQLARVGVEHVGVASDFVHRPAAAEAGDAARARPGPGRS